MYWNDWKLQLHWNKLDWVNPRSQIKISKGDITSHWVGNSDLKELDINDFFD